MKKVLVVGGVIVTVVVGGFLGLLVLASLEEQSDSMDGMGHFPVK